MKIDRLLEIIIFLMNHETVTARQLAEKFGVSLRTIQRDITSISLSGIPVTSETGSRGGYSILPDYKIKNQFITDTDFSLIVTALKSLSTAFESTRLQTILEKYRSLSNSKKQNVFLDYSVTKENTQVLEYSELIRTALSRSVELIFDYRNAADVRSSKQVQPIALRFKWYAWYLYAFDTKKRENRTYKVARMGNLKITDIRFRLYKNSEELIQASDQQYLKTCECIKVRCRSNAVTELNEYFPDEEKVMGSDGSCLLYLRVPPNERLWQALLLGMGDKITILSPSYYRDKLIRLAKNFLSNYDIQMS